LGKDGVTPNMNLLFVFVFLFVFSIFTSLAICILPFLSLPKIQIAKLAKMGRKEEAIGKRRLTSHYYILDLSFGQNIIIGGLVHSLLSRYANHISHPIFYFVSPPNQTIRNIK